MAYIIYWYSAPDLVYSKNALCALNLISTLLLKVFKDNHTIDNNPHVDINTTHQTANIVM